MLNSKSNILVHFRRQYLLFLLVVLAFMGAFISLLLYQNQQYIDYDNKILLRHFLEYKTLIDNRFKRINDEMEELRIAAETDLFDSSHTEKAMPFAYSLVKGTPEGKFHLDDIDNSFKNYIVVNLTGIGTLKDRSPDLYRILRMQLKLMSDFNGFKKEVPEVRFLYSYTKEKTYVQHPWEPSSSFSFNEELYNYEIWKSSLPEANPERKAFWAKLYFDNGGQGLMTTCAVPVYDNNKFVGIIGADLTVDFLNTIAEKFEPERGGRMIIYDQDKNLLACPGVITSKDKSIRKINDGLPPDLVNDIAATLALPPDTITEMGGWKAMASDLSSGPFKIMYAAPSKTILTVLMDRLGYAAIGIIACMFLMMIYSIASTHRNFVQPSKLFLTYVLARSASDTPPATEKMPGFWQPWFKTAGEMFDKNEKLNREIKDRNSELEKKNLELSKNIRARDAAEQENLKLGEQLRQSEKMRVVGQLAGGIAHDFNNQLSIILGYSEILQGELHNSPTLYKYTKNIYIASKRSADLTKQLLAFSRQGKYQSVPVNMHDIIWEIITLLGRSIDKRIKFIQNLNAEQHIALGDPSQLHNSILNITINARDAMPQGGKIFFESRNRILDVNNPQNLLAGNYIEISISDTGTGMDDETQKRIFEPFFTTKKKGEGTGLGLAAVYGTMKNHGGAIEASSELGKGATFRIFLPAADIKLQQEDDRGGLKSIAQVQHKFRILVIDDEDVFCQMLTDILRPVGYEVTTLGNGIEASEYYRKNWENIDLVILDMLMPEMNGHDTFMDMKGVNPGIKVIITTGFSIDSDVRKLVEAGVLYVIQKPFDPMELLQKMQGILKP
ncbi:MAG: response regulator [Victivallales bacterium]